MRLWICSTTKVPGEIGTHGGCHKVQCWQVNFNDSLCGQWYFIKFQQYDVIESYSSFCLASHTVLTRAFVHETPFKTWILTSPQRTLIQDSNPLAVDSKNIKINNENYQRENRAPLITAILKFSLLLYEHLSQKRNHDFHFSNIKSNQIIQNWTETTQPKWTKTFKFNHKQSRSSGTNKSIDRPHWLQFPLIIDNYDDVDVGDDAIDSNESASQPLVRWLL